MEQGSSSLSRWYNRDAMSMHAVRGAGSNEGTQERLHLEAKRQRVVIRGLGCRVSPVRTLEVFATVWGSNRGNRTEVRQQQPRQHMGQHIYGWR